MNLKMKTRYFSFVVLILVSFLIILGLCSDEFLSLMLVLLGSLSLFGSEVF